MMDIAAKNRQIANSYYNLGLEKAKGAGPFRSSTVPEKKPAFF